MNPAYGAWEPGSRMRPAGAHRSGLYVFRPGTEHRRRTYLDEEPIGSQCFPLPPDTAASIELWRTVVFDGVALAARDPEPIGELKSRQYQRDLIVKINEARAWITSTAFDEVCELAMLNPVPLRRAIALTPPPVPQPAPPPKPKRPPGTWKAEEEQRKLRRQREWERAFDEAWHMPWSERKKRKKAVVVPRRPPPPPWSPDEPEAPPGWEWHPTY